MDSKSVNFVHKASTHRMKAIQEKIGFVYIKGPNEMLLDLRDDSPDRFCFPKQERRVFLPVSLTIKPVLPSMPSNPIETPKERNTEKEEVAFPKSEEFYQEYQGDFSQCFI